MIEFIVFNRGSSTNFTQIFVLEVFYVAVIYLGTYLYGKNYRGASTNFDVSLA